MHWLNSFLDLFLFFVFFSPQIRNFSYLFQLTSDMMMFILRLQSDELYGVKVFLHFFSFVFLMLFLSTANDRYGDSSNLIFVASKTSSNFLASKDLCVSATRSAREQTK